MGWKSKILLSAICALLVSFCVMNFWAREIVDLNAGLRSFLTGGPAATRSFSPEGLPYTYSPRIQGAIISPFYVVHYGVLYSEACRKDEFREKAHWLEDKSLGYWPFPPENISMEKFKTSADWVVDNARAGDTGLTHVFYEFDWPYASYRDGKLKAPWWSGLTDAYATTLLLRAWDCFGDQKYLDRASQLYTSAVSPVSKGGSLSSFNGYPWIDEYVDPRMPPEALSKVLNGMIYSYQAIKAYEAFVGRDNIASALKVSIYRNIGAYDMGYWSKYDAVGSIANIKYHTIQTVLIGKGLLNDGGLDALASRWRVGDRYPAVFYAIYGPPSISKLHFIMTFAAIFLAVFASVYFVLDRRSPTQAARS